MMIPTLFHHVLVVLAFLASTSRGFLFEDDQCPYGKPCVCSLGSISCQNRDLTAVPKMKAPQVHFYHSMDISQNLITSLPAWSFSKLAVGMLVVGPNPLVQIDDEAFVGLNVSWLILASIPAMTKIPTSVGQINNLKTLYVYNTNITVLEDPLMKGIGDTLEELVIARTNITIWPNSLKYATALKRLDAGGNKYNTIPDNAFEGFYETLQSLSLDNCGLTVVPKVALGHLERLMELDLSKNLLIHFPDDSFGSKLQNSLLTLYISTTSITDVPRPVRSLARLDTLGLGPNPIKKLSSNSFGGLNTTLSKLYMAGCQMERLPPVIKTLTHLTILDLTQTGLKTIQDDDFKGLSSLNELNVDRNSFIQISQHAFRGLSYLRKLTLFQSNLTEFPKALNDLPEVQTVYIYENQITKIPANSTVGLRSLQQLVINDNPISEVADHAFDGAFSLGLIMLDRANMTTVPKAIASIRGATRITLSDNPVQCTCDLKWLIAKPYIQVAGDCHNIPSSISEYIKTALRNC